MPIDCYRFLPQYWNQNYKTDFTYDAILNELLDSNPIITNLDAYTITFNNTATFWITNFPYAYGYLYVDAHYKYKTVLPAVATRLRLRQIVYNERVRQKKIKYEKAMLPNENTQLLPPPYK